MARGRPGTALFLFFLLHGLNQPGAEAQDNLLLLIVVYTVFVAIATELLSDEQDHARDFGIVNVTAALGQLIGPMQGAALVALVGGFWLVFLMAAVLSVAGGLMTALARQPEPVPAPR